MFRSPRSVAALLSLVLASASVVAHADPGNGKGQGQGQGQGQGKGNPHASQDGGHKGKNGSYRSHGPAVDRSSVINVIGGYRDYWSPGPALPPGIQKNLARGKPLPPGIAKKLDNRLVGHLPHYDGYEWQQVGTDLILVAIASGLIYEVLDNVFH